MVCQKSDTGSIIPTTPTTTKSTTTPITTIKRTDEGSDTFVESNKTVEDLVRTIKQMLDQVVKEAEDVSLRYNNNKSQVRGRERE